MQHHNLKAHPDSFELMKMRISGVQLRKNDRNFKVGDRCTFREWDPERNVYTGHTISMVPIQTMLFEHEGLTPGWCLIVLYIPPTDISRFDAAVAGKAEIKEFEE